MVCTIAYTGISRKKFFLFRLALLSNVITSGQNFAIRIPTTVSRDAMTLNIVAYIAEAEDIVADIIT